MKGQESRIQEVFVLQAGRLPRLTVTEFKNSPVAYMYQTTVGVEAVRFFQLRLL